MSKFVRDGLPCPCGDSSDGQGELDLFVWQAIKDPVLRRKEYKKWWNRDQRKKFPDKVREKYRQVYKKDHPPQEKIKKSYSREYSLWRSAKDSSRKKGREFSIDVEDIIIPTHCPILGHKLDITEKRSHDSPSIDRVDSSKGYIKDNIQIISWRANMLKSNMTLEECEKLLLHLRSISG